MDEMNAHLEEKLSALLDGELDGAELVAAESHLMECGRCQAELEELRGIKRLAGALEDRPPARDLWVGIAARLRETNPAADPDVIPLAPRRRRVSFSVPQLAAAAVALMVLSAGGAGGLALLLNRAADVAPGTSVVRPTAGMSFASLDKTAAASGVATYDGAIRELETALATRRTRLDTATVRVIEQSLRLIDFAIGQAREALARDPDNLYLNNHLQDALGRKLDLLRHVVTLPTVS
jgi:anti-sigma factor RsiW